MKDIAEDIFKELEEIECLFKSVIFLLIVLGFLMVLLVFTK